MGYLLGEVGYECKQFGVELYCEGDCGVSDTDCKVYSSDFSVCNFMFNN